MSWEFIESSDDNIIDLDDNIKNIFNNDVDKEIVLCVGKVQSGKTNKILSAIKYALNELRYDIAIVFAGTNTDLYQQTQKRLKDFGFSDDIKLIEKNQLSYSKHNNNQKWIISIIKNKKGLDEMHRFVYEIDNKFIKNKKVLIIDDESDYASVNISKSSDSTSSTYKLIHQIYKHIYKGKLLQITATPFANILSKKSKELRANRVLCWSNYDDYKGLFEFDEIKDDIYEIIELNKNEVSQWNKYIQKALNYFISTIINNYNYLVTLDKEITCLFNFDDDTNEHTQIIKCINAAWENIKKSTDIFYNKFINKNINKQDFKNILSNVSNNIQIIEFNGNNQEEKKEVKFFIYVGGIKASRGFTFENLICEMIINSPNDTISVDTLLQRCRWFGDRKHIINMMKIYMNEDIYYALIECKRYVELLEPGEHNITNLYNQIVALDQNCHYVKATRKG